MRIAITGAAGYIGAQLGARLAADHTVLGIDVRAVATGFPLRVLDIRDPALAQVLTDGGIDAVVHLAAVLEPTGDRVRDHEIDVHGTRNVLAACRAAGVRHLTVTSSGAAYGYHADNAEWLTEDHPLRGNAEFSYADHKRQVEELLREHRAEHPEVGQLVFRVGTVLGTTTRNQITALFHKPRLVAVRGHPSPFVFLWDQDLVEALAFGVTHHRTGIFNMAGSGALSIQAIAHHLGKPVLALPAWLLRGTLALSRPLGLSRYGPEQVRFLQYRPVLSNAKLLAEFGWQPTKSSRDALRVFAEAQGLGWQT